MQNGERACYTSENGDRWLLVLRADIVSVRHILMPVLGESKTCELGAFPTAPPSLFSDRVHIYRPTCRPATYAGQLRRVDLAESERTGSSAVEVKIGVSPAQSRGWSASSSRASQ